MFTYLSQYAEQLHSKPIQTILFAALAILMTFPELGWRRYFAGSPVAVELG